MKTQGGMVADKLCNNVPAVKFVSEYKNKCDTFAAQLEVPVENFLGLAAQESQYGTGRIARECNNYFSMHAPAKYQSGSQPARGNPKVQVAEFSSFEDCAKSFVSRFGADVKGKKDPKEFAKALVAAGFNSGDASSGGRDGFIDYLVDIISAVKRRMQCSTK